MSYTVETKTGKTLLDDGDEVQAIRAVTQHSAPDVLIVTHCDDCVSGDEFLQRYDASDAIRQLRGMWSGDGEAREMLELRKDARGIDPSDPDWSRVVRDLTEKGEWGKQELGLYLYDVGPTQASVNVSRLLNGSRSPTSAVRAQLKRLHTALDGTSVKDTEEA